MIFPEENRLLPKIEFIDGSVRIGTHVGKCRTLCETLFNNLHYKNVCGQVYICNPRGYCVPKVHVNDLILTKSLAEYSLFRMYVHGCLLYNLNGATHIDDIDSLIAHAKDQTKRLKLIEDKEKMAIQSKKTIDGLVDELDICSLSFGTGVVVHIGSGVDKCAALPRIANSIVKALTQESTYNALPKNRRVILENAAGEGNKIGSTLEEIRDILALIDEEYQHQISICIDTCHLFAAGEYNISKISEVKRFFKDFDKMIGLNRLRLIHLNDSKGMFGCKKDRHETLLDGYIFGTAIITLEYLVKFCNEHSIDMVLETPGVTFEEIDLVYDLSKK